MKLLNQYCVHLASLAQKAVLYEVSASPKPGLVDRYNAGAHKDMDFYTFMASSAALFEGFYGCALAGVKFTGEDLRQLLVQIRPIGMQAEEKMFKATKGVNTHKGIIFSLGIICAVAGNIYQQKNIEQIPAEEICAQVMEMTGGITAHELTNLQATKTLTNGERLFKQYKLRGIRGEVESGFRTVRAKGLPVLRDFAQANKAVLDQNLDQVQNTELCQNIEQEQNIEQAQKTVQAQNTEQAQNAVLCQNEEQVRRETLFQKVDQLRNTACNLNVNQCENVDSRHVILNDLLLQTLLNIMTICEDTNIVSRHDLDTLLYVQNYAKEVLAVGGAFSASGKERLLAMDQEFIARHISPGGSADLLAVSVMLALLEGVDI